MDTNYEFINKLKLNKLFMGEIIYKELSYKLVGCFFKVRNAYGKCHRENIYHKALLEELNLEEIRHISKPKINLYSINTGKKIGY